MNETATVSLYLDLVPGEKADLEVVSRAALAWVAAIRDIAMTLDPMSEVRVELASGTEGSLSLNSVVRRLRGALPSRGHLRAIVLGVLFWMGQQGAEWTYGKVLDAIAAGVHPDVTKGMSQAEIEEIARQVTTAIRPTVAEEAKRQLFRELERDQSIRGAGATERPGEKPQYIVPRSEFSRRAGQQESDLPDDRKRKIVTELEVVLVSPVLKDAERSWRFQHHVAGEFGAKMKDHDFLEAFKLGRIDVPLRPGVRMRIELQTKEELEDGVWEVKERNVTRVVDPGGRGQFLLPTD